MSRYSKFVITKGVAVWDEKTQRYVTESVEGYDYDGPWALATHDTNPNWVAQDFKFFYDDAAIGSVTQIGAENAAIDYPLNDRFILVINLGESAGASVSNTGAWTLEYQVNGGATESWTAVGSATSVRFVASPNTTDGATFTSKLGDDISGVATWTSSWNQFRESTTAFTSRTWSDNGAEYAWCLQVVGLSISDVVTFRLRSPSSSTITSPTNTPQLTVSTILRSLSYNATGTSVLTKQVSRLKSLAYSATGGYSGSGGGPITVVQSKVGTGTSPAFDSNTTAGNTVLLFVASAMNVGTAPGTYTIGGSGGSESWTKTENETTTGWEAFLAARCHGITGGWTGITISHSLSVATHWWALIEVSAIDATTPHLETREAGTDTNWATYASTGDQGGSGALGSFTAPSSQPVGYFTASIYGYLNSSATDYYDLHTTDGWTQIDATGTTDTTSWGGGQGHVQWKRRTDTTQQHLTLYVNTEQQVESFGYALLETTSGGTSGFSKQVNYNEGTTYYETPTYSATGTLGTVLKAVGLLKSYSATGTSALTKAVALLKSYSATGTQTVTKLVGLADKAFSATGTSVLSYAKQYARALVYSAVGTLGTLVKDVGKVLAYSGTGSSALSRVASRLKSLAFSATGSTSLSAISTRLMSLAYSATGTLATLTQKVKLLSLAFSATGTSALQKTVGLLRSFSATGTSVLTKAATRLKSIAYSATGTLGTLLKEVQLPRAFSATGTSVLNTLKVKLLSLAYSATGTNALTKSATYVRSLAYNATGTVVRGALAIGKVLAYTATGAVVLVRGGSEYTKNLVFSAAGTLALAANATYAETKAYAATGTLALTKSVGKLFSYAATGSQTVTKGVSKAFSYAATGTLGVLDSAIGFAESYAYSAIGTVTRAVQVAKNLTYSAVGTLTTAKDIALSFAYNAIGTLSTGLSYAVETIASRVWVLRRYGLFKNNRR